MPDSSVRGLAELSRKLNSLPAKIAGRVLRQATMNATTPALKEMKRAAPKGKRAHRTYKGNLVAPGFLSRSIKRKSRLKGGKARVEIGVKKEAFYGVLFVEKGTRAHRIPKKGERRMAFGGRVYSHVNHPGARAKPWFKRSFIKNEKVMLTRLRDHLRVKIERYVR